MSFQKTNNININLPETIEVVQKRAATDESVRLFRELKEEALKSVLSEIKLEINSFKISIVSINMNRDRIGNSVTLYALFELNGTRETLYLDLPDEIKDAIVDYSFKRKPLDKGYLKHFKDYLTSVISNIISKHFIDSGSLKISW